MKTDSRLEFVKTKYKRTIKFFKKYIRKEIQNKVRPRCIMSVQI